MQPEIIELCASITEKVLEDAISYALQYTKLT